MKHFKLIVLLSFFTFLVTSCDKDVHVENDSQTLELITPDDIPNLSNYKLRDSIKLDYHEKYGTIRANDFPMEKRGTEITLETFLEKANLKKEDLAEYRITEKRFTGIGLAEHRIGDEVVEVYHQYKDVPVKVLEGKTVDGHKIVVVVIIVCSNGLVIIIIIVT